MAVKKFEWAADNTDLRGAEYVILLWITWYASEDGGNSHASAATLARRAHCSERYTRKVLSSLESRGIILRSGTKGGKYKGTVVWSLNFDYQTPELQDRGEPEGRGEPEDRAPLNHSSATPEPQFRAPLSCSSPNPVEIPFDPVKDPIPLPASAGPDADASRKKSDPYPSLSKLPTASNGRRTYPDEFEQFWDDYPKHEDKAEGYKAWRNAVKRGVSAEEIRAGAQGYAQQCRARDTSPRHIKNAQGWINGDRFTNNYATQADNRDDMTDADRAYYALLAEQESATDYLDAEVVDTTFTQEIA